MTLVNDLVRASLQVVETENCPKCKGGTFRPVMVHGGAEAGVLMCQECAALFGVSMSDEPGAINFGPFSDDALRSLMSSPAGAPLLYLQIQIRLRDYDPPGGAGCGCGHCLPASTIDAESIVASAKQVKNSLKSMIDEYEKAIAEEETNEGRGEEPAQDAECHGALMDGPGSFLEGTKSAIRFAFVIAGILTIEVIVAYWIALSL